MDSWILPAFPFIVQASIFSIGMVRFENSLIHNIRLNPSKDPIERFEIDNSTVHGLSNFSGQTKSQTLTDSLFLDFNPNMHQGDLQISDSFLIEPSFIPGWSTDAKKNSLQLDNVGVYLNNRSALETVLPAFNEMRQFMGEDDPTVQEVDKVCVYAGDALVAGNDCPAFEDRVVVRFETSETIRLDEYFVQGTWDINDRAIFNDENRVVSASTSVVGSNRFQQSIVKDRIAASGAAVKCS